MKKQEAGKKRPNLIFLIADDHRFDAIGVSGNPVVQTPVLDQLAEAGVLFKSIYMMGGRSAAVCVPSRACLLTGTNVFRATATVPEGVALGDTENQAYWRINPELVTFPEALRHEGYRTFGIGKWHNGKESFARSFSGGAEIFFGGMGDHIGLPVHHYDPEGIFPDEAATLSKTFSSELFADAAINMIQSDQQDDPYLLYVAFTAPHDPRTPPQAYLDLYPAANIPLPGNFAAKHPFDNGEMDIRDEQLAPTPRTPEAIRQHLADYYGMISHLDTQIGRILQALKDSGQDQHTIIIYTADHGLALGQHGLMGKQNLYEHSIHIPLIASGYGVPQGLEVSGLGAQMDIYPTLCEWTGIPLPETIEGISLVPLIEGKPVVIRDYVCSAYKDIQRMSSDGRWKMIRYYRSGGVGSDRIQLFDLLNDPLEIDDLIGDPIHQGHQGRLEAALLQWQQRVNDPLLLKSCGHGF
jgi:arylsulfatase A-like enzyme